MVAFFQQRWFLIALISVLLAGIAFPASMRPITGRLSGDVILALVTFVMALPLETSVLWRAVRRPGPAWVGAFLSSGVAPPLGWLASRMLSEEMAAGVILATTVPSTLASAAVLTRRARGNDAIAFLVTMITSLTCFVVIPAWLWLLVGVRAEVDFGEIVVGLMLFVMLPIIAAQLFRQWRAIGMAASQHKALLSNLAQVGILVMVLIGAVYCGERLSSLEDESPISVMSLLHMIFSVTTIHVVLVMMGFVVSRAIGWNHADSIAVAFAGGQKTLMVGAYLALAFGPLAILPMVAYHAVQLIIDTVIADWLRERTDVASLKPELR